MADVNAAVKYVLEWEDSTLSGKITKDTGGLTRFGIAEKYHPELVASLFYSTMGSEAALKISEGIYDICYCQPLCIELIDSQAIANKLLSLGVNCGCRTAAKMLQDALGVDGDGRIGPLTLHALDEAKETDVLERLRIIAVRHYEALIQANPSLAMYRNGWIRRAMA